MTDGKSKLLIVDDDTGIQRQLKWSFEDYEVFVAGDADAAMAVFRSEVPPVVTVDLGLPPEPDGATQGFFLLEEILGRVWGYRTYRSHGTIWPLGADWPARSYRRSGANRSTRTHRGYRTYRATRPNR